MVRLATTALLVAYDGTRGWAWEPTIKAVVAETMARIVREPVELEAASRTDAGVHARGQVTCASTNCEPLRGDYALLQYRLNQLLPDDVAVLDAVPVPETFDVRANAGKEYHYRLRHARTRGPLTRRWEWHKPQPHTGPDFEPRRARDAATALLGTHDFSAFGNVQPADASRDGVCTLSRFDLVCEGHGTVHWEVEGDRFVYKMVRNLVGAVARCGAGELDVDFPARVLQAGEWPRAGVAKLTAPAHGLVLQRILFADGIDPFQGDLRADLRLAEQQP